MGKSCAECLYWTQVTCLSFDPGALLSHIVIDAHTDTHAVLKRGCCAKRNSVFMCQSFSFIGPRSPAAFPWTPILWLTCDPRMHRAQSNSTGSFDRLTRPHAVYTFTLHKWCVSPLMLTQYVKCTAALLKLWTSEDFCVCSAITHRK